MIEPQKQIVVQDVLQNLIDKLPEFKVNDTETKLVSFGFGDESEISRTIKESSSTIYPLVWLLPSKNDNDVFSNIVSRDLNIIVATIENRKELFNKQRLEDSFKKTLFPVRDYLVHVLRNSGATKLKGVNVATYEYPGYIKNDESISIDNWDAIRIECTVDFKRDKCIKNFTWKT